MASIAGEQYLRADTRPEAHQEPYYVLRFKDVRSLDFILRNEEKVLKDWEEESDLIVIFKKRV